MKIITFLLVIVFFNSCTKKKHIEPLTNGNIIPQSYLTTLKYLGLRTDLVEDYEKFLLVEGDIMFRKQYLDSIYEINRLGHKTNQAMWSGNFLIRGAVNNIKVYADGSVPTEWKLALQDAVAYWTGISGSVVTMITSGVSANIIISSDNGGLNNNVIASAGFPISNTAPYSQILINLDYNSNAYVSPLQKTYNLVHELGHCIGFRHTNWNERGEPMNDLYEINHGVANNDANSVMNGGTANNTWSGFSVHDILAAELVYPQWNSYTQLGSPVWLNTDAMTSLSGYVYVVQNSRLYKITPTTGAYSQIGGAVWAMTNAMCSLGSDIYLVQNSRLYKVNPTTGGYVQLGGAVWPGTEAMCSLGTNIYIVQNSRLYKVNSSTGSYVQLGGAVWSGTNAICSLGTDIYLVQNSRLYKVNSSTGSYVQLGNAVWASTHAITANSGNNYLYIIQNDVYHKVSPINGTYNKLGGIEWRSTDGMTSIGGFNYVIENSRFYQLALN